MPAKGHMHLLRLLSNILLTSICTALIFFGIYFNKFIYRPILPFSASQTTVIVEPGMDVEGLLNQLQAQKIEINPILFHVLAFSKHADKRMRTGEYLITTKTTPNSLLDRIIAGKVYMRKITFIEGWTFKDMRKRLQKNPYIKHATANLSDAQIMKLLSAESDMPEGLFFPDTYEYTYGNTDLVILKNSYRYMTKYLAKQWLKRDLNLPYQNSYDALIVASMIEKEGLLNKEKPIIAGVILNRLEKNMRLQIDPTVLYGMGKSYRSPITSEDIWNKNPYNTYRNAGLPPTPISMPGAVSIQAALHPQLNDYLYYVAKGDGGHQFSTSYHDHQIAVASYRSFMKMKNMQKMKSLAQVDNFCSLIKSSVFFTSLGSTYPFLNFSSPCKW